MSSVTDKLGFSLDSLTTTSTPTPSTPQTEEDRYPYPQLNAFRPWLSTELKRRIKVYDTGAGSSTMVAPFVRFVSCQEDKGYNYRFFTMGLHGYTADDLQTNLFDSVHGSHREIVGYAYDKTSGKKTLIDASQLTLGQLPPVIMDSFDTNKVNAITNVRAANQNRQVSLAQLP